MQNKPLAERSILLVEDDIILSTDVAFALTEAGCKAVVPATANAAALSAMDALSPDVDNAYAKTTIREGER